jgi:sporulation protein YunB
MYKIEKGLKLKKRKNKPSKIVLFNIFFSSFLIILIILDFRLRPIIKSVMADRAKAVAIMAIDTAIAKQLNKEDFKYPDIIKIERNNDGKLIGITTDIQKINSLKTNISSAILEELSKTEMRKIGIPLGAIFGIEIFSGVGPIIPAKIFVTGNVSTEFQSEFLEAGINQTKHLINLNTSVNVRAIVPGYPVQENVKTNMTIAETIIVGEVPHVFAASEPTKRMREAKALEGLDND